MQCGIFSELPRSTSVILAELAAEMLYIVITAVFGNFPYGLCGKLELVLGAVQTAVYYVIHAGNSKHLLIQGLQAAGTLVVFFCHLRNIPWSMGLVTYFFVQPYQRLCVYIGRLVCNSFMKF